MLQPFDCDGAEKNKHKFMIQSMTIEGDNNGNLEQIVRLSFFILYRLSGKKPIQPSLAMPD